MRIHLPAWLIALVLAAPADAATRNFGITGFDKVRVEGPFRVRLSTGVAPFASASGSAAAIDRVKLEVLGQTLIVRSDRSSWGGYPGEEAGAVEINLGTHELKSAALNGSGSLQIDRVEGLLFDFSIQGSGSGAIGEVDVDQLKVAVWGAGSAALAGRSGTMRATLRGVSTLDAGGLVTKDAIIGADGPSTIRATVTNAAKIDATGVATVTLAGEPACITKLYGSAGVSGCRSTQ